MEITTFLLFLNILNSMGYSLIGPLFPILGKESGLSDAIIGWVISGYPFANIFITPFIPYLSHKFTRFRLLYFSTFFVASCTIAYAFLYYISSFYPLIIWAFCIRIIHGFSSGIVFTLVYSLTISLSNKESTQKNLGYLELGLCFGISCGPLIASFFYKIGGYPLPFYFSGIFLYLSVYLTSKMGKEQINSKDNDNDNDNDNEDKESPPFFKFLYYTEILIILGSFYIILISGTFYLPCLSNYLIQKYNFSVSLSSLFFIIPTIFYITILQLLDVISKRLGLYLTSSIGLLITSLGCFLLAPIIGIFNNIFFLIVGFGFIGAGQAPVFIPLLIVLSKCIIRMEKNLDELTANDITTSLNNVFVAIGEFSGPIIGGYITTYFGFNYCCFWVSFLVLLYFGIFSYYFYNEIINKVQEKEELLEKEGDKEIININNFRQSFINYKKFYFLGINEKKGKHRKFTFNLEGNENENRRNSLYSSLTN